MSGKRVVVIGAGLSGLAAGIFARQNGYQALVLEHSAQPGGVSATWKRQGYTIDGGVHFYMGCLRPGPTRELFRSLGVWQEEKYRPLETYARFLDPARGRSLDLTVDLERFAAQAKSISPADGKFLETFLAGARAFSGLDLAATLARPPELTSAWDSLKAFWSMRSTLRYFSGRFARPMTEVVRGLKDPWLRQVFLNIFLPRVPYFFVLMLAGLLADRNLAVRMDGSAGFNKALEKRLSDLGGQVRYRSRVTKILIQGGRATGVGLADGTEVLADHVVSAADGHSTLYELLGAEHVPPRLAAIHKRLDLFDPIVLVNIGVAAELKGLPENLILKSPHPPQAGFLLNDWWFVRVFGPERGCAPGGKTLVQVMADSVWAPWRKLREDEAAYRAEKENLADQVVQALACLHPDLPGLVEMVDVASPHTWWRYTLNREGAYEGFAISARSFRTKVPRTLPGLDNLVLAGQWTVPGGGAIPSLLSGRHAAMLIRHREGLPFA